MRRRRWSDNDRYFGPFTYAKSGPRGFEFDVVLYSGDEDYPGCSLRVTLCSYTLISRLPEIINPWREKVIAHSWTPEQIERRGGNFYFVVHRRKYGFQYHNGFLQVFYGRDTDDSRTRQVWSTFLPWTQWRHIRLSLYGLSGEHFWTQFDPTKILTAGQHHERFVELSSKEDECPSRTFAFADYDGERLTAKTRIEEREWRAGTGRFKWLSLFRRPRIQRYLEIDFSGETGKRKGSWKGGTIGSSVQIQPGELHESAFRRYCQEHDMAFIGSADEETAILEQRGGGNGG